MKKIILALLVCFFLIGCQPKAPEVQEKITTPEPQALPTETAAEPEVTETSPAPVENIPAKTTTGKIDLQVICEKIMTAEEFASICGLEASRITTTAKASEHTCWVTFVDRMARSYTAGFTTVDWVTAEEVNSEFERGMKQRRATAEATVGDRNYGFGEINRENIVWQRGTFLTRIGASTELCSKEKLAELAQAVDAKLY
ncbi:MAG: hypothetical protein QW666_01325 [Candidatus Woesearchaeota archaeon]